MEKAKLVAPVVCVTGTIEKQRHWVGRQKKINAEFV
jgi:hypothetical protein